jgi:perosamine synthetase
VTSRLTRLARDLGLPLGLDPRPAFAADLESWYGGTCRAFLFHKGRVALHALCRALGIGPGDEVVLPGYTCVVVPQAFAVLGARPVYVDIDPAAFNATPEALLAAVGPRTRLVLVQHTYGIPVATRELVRSCRTRGVAVAEDACHAFGTRVDGAPAGTVADAGFLSLQWNKPVCAGLGGVLLVSDRDLAARVEAAREGLLPASASLDVQLRALRVAHGALVTPRTHGLAQAAYRALTAARLVPGSSSPGELQGRLPADYYRDMAPSTAEAGRVAARDFAGNVRHRERLQGLYRDLLAGTPFAPAPEVPGTLLSRYPVRVANKAELARIAPLRGVELGTWFETPLHPIPLERHPDLGYRPGCCPEAEKAAREVVNLPHHARTSEADARRAVAFLLRYGKPAE